MNEVAPRKRQVIGWFFLILLIQFGGFMLNAPDWIPGWQNVIIGVTVFLYLVALVALFIWGKRVFHNGKLRMANAKALGRSVLLGVLMLIWVAMTFVFTALFFDKEFMGNVYVNEHDFPQHNTTIYIYDDSFLDPATTFKVRKGTMPWMEFKERVPNMEPQNLEVTEQDSQVVITDGVRIFTYFFNSGEHKIGF